MQGNIRSHSRFRLRYSPCRSQSPIIVCKDRMGGMTATLRNVPTEDRSNDARHGGAGRHAAAVFCRYPLNRVRRFLANQMDKRRRAHRNPLFLPCPTPRTCRGATLGRASEAPINGYPRAVGDARRHRQIPQHPRCSLTRRHRKCPGKRARRPPLPHRDVSAGQVCRKLGRPRSYRFLRANALRSQVDARATKVCKVRTGFGVGIFTGKIGCSSEKHSDPSGNGRCSCIAISRGAVSQVSVSSRLSVLSVGARRQWSQEV
jgi:hypothetical protein